MQRTGITRKGNRSKQKAKTFQSNFRTVKTIFAFDWQISLHEIQPTPTDPVGVLREKAKFLLDEARLPQIIHRL